tara:strand:+ start:253 stop:591 length:339 start_codon:yes stop_codon:yes gene_type:complete
MTQAELIKEFEHLFERVDTEGRPQLALMVRWFCFTLRPGHSERVEAGATMLAAIRMLALAAEKPGLLPNEAKFAQDAMKRASSRIKLLAEDLMYQHRESRFPWMPDLGGEGG